MIVNDWIRRLYYRFLDARAQYRLKREIPLKISNLATHKLFVVLTGPARAPGAELLTHAFSRGVRTEDLTDYAMETVVSRLAALHGEWMGEQAGLYLVRIAPEMVGTVSLPEPLVKVLLLPARKKYFKALARGLSPAERAREAAVYDSLEATSADYAIILNESEAPRQLFPTLIGKLDAFLRLGNLREQAYPEAASHFRCFVIWGHGLAFQRELSERIGQEFEVIATVDRTIDDLSQFVREMYIEEVLRIGHHILKKNEHLARFPRRAVLLLARDRGAARAFECAGHGKTRALCTSFEQHFKQLIRDQYNPRLTSGERTEYHVIHAADTPCQVDNILRMFDLKPLSEWLAHDR